MFVLLTECLVRVLIGRLLIERNVLLMKERYTRRMTCDGIDSPSST